TNSPSFLTREAETTAVVQDGEAVIIGGIIDDTVSHNIRGIPFLMDIPVLGWAFRTNNDSTIRTELLILIPPYVIRNRPEASEVTDEFSSRVAGLKSLSEAVRKRHHEYLEERAHRRLEEQSEEPQTAPSPGAPTP